VAETRLKVSAPGAVTVL